MSVLLIMQEIPEDPANGVHLRRWHLLGQGNAAVLCVERGSAPVHPSERLRWDRTTVLSDHGRPCRVNRWRNGPQSFRANAPLADRLLAAIAEHRNSMSGLSLVIGDYALALLLVGRLDMPFAFDPTDSAALYFRRRAAALRWQQPLRAINSLSWAWAYRRAEKRVSRHAAVCVLTAERDRQSIRSAFPRAQTCVIPNGTSLVEQGPVAYRLGAQPVIGFHGIMTFAPNRSSAVYLSRKVLPLVRRSVPNAVLRIAGAPVTRDLSALAQQPGVEVCGFVPDLHEWLAECSVYAMPMREGSGVKNKLAESLAAGLPVVTNSMGAEALPSSCRGALVIADGAHAVAREIVNLIHDRPRANALRVRARAAAVAEFGWGPLARAYRGAIAASQAPASIPHYRHKIAELVPSAQPEP